MTLPTHSVRGPLSRINAAPPAYRYTMILIVAGVSGSGKTTVGALIAGRLRWQFADADDFHPASAT